MKTLQQFSHGLESIPAVTSWYLADIGEAKGRQELFIKQSPQRLKVLREHALIESAVSSNRIEGVEVEHKRIGTIVFGHRHLQDRSEEEVRGYREALDLIHSQGSMLAVTEAHIQELHRLTRGEKTGMVVSAVEHAPDRFSVADLQKACPHVSLDMIRRVLKDMQSTGRIQCIVRGKHALWEKHRKAN